MKKRIKFSLFVGTLDRPDIISLCVEKFRSQSYKDFEIIIIDQSENDRTEQIISRFSDERIKYIRVNFKGLSKARNKAIEIMTGDYFCLIDDDADYAMDYLDKAIEAATKNPEKIISGYILNTYTGEGIVNYNHLRKNRDLNLREIIRFCPSAGLIFPKSVIDKVGVFDEEFGVGARFGATEETDYLLRCYKMGYKIIHNPELYIEHPIFIGEKPKEETVSIKKIYSYAMGGGALFKKHLHYGKEYKLIPILIENMGRLFVKRIVKNNDVTKARYKGFIEGWKEYKQ